jgi:hypothetical protein
MFEVEWFWISFAYFAALRETAFDFGLIISKKDFSWHKTAS